MSAPRRDPYETLGVNRGASDEALRAAYRRLVQLHHPDHNGGSAEAARRFEEIQEAYAQITRLRKVPPHVQPTPPREAADPQVESRLADIERQVREAHAARERARRAAREAAVQTEQRPSDEELGYVTTDDTFSKLLADARSEIAERFAEGRRHPAAKRVADLIDEIALKLGGEGSSRSGDKT
jgi:DnaJ domain